MNSKNIFNKKKIGIKFFTAIILTPILLFFFFIYNHNYNKEFIIPIFEDKYFIIPEDKGGQKITNTNKKILHLNKKNIIALENNNIKNLIYSIQFLVSNDYDKVSNYFINIVSNQESIYNKEDFYLLSFDTGIGIDYFLLYKNFNNYDDAFNFCKDYLYKIDNCLIVNAQNFNY